MDDLKKDYIQIIKDLKLNHEFEEACVDFVKTADTKNEGELMEFMYQLVKLLKKYKIYEVKARGYDNILQTENHYDTLLEEAKAEFELTKELNGQNIPLSYDTLS